MLTEQQIRQFDDQGFLLGGQVLTPDEADRLAEDIERVIRDKDRKDVRQPVLLRNLSGDPARPVWQIVNIWQACPAFEKLMRHPVILEEVAQITRAAELRIWHDQVQYKPRETGGVNMWHQDSPLWANLMPKHEQVSAWVALDDVDESNGCMTMVPGSHKWGDQINHFGTFKGFENLPPDFNGHEVRRVLCPVRKGHVHYHHALTWHGSHANTSGRPRRAIAFHYMTERTYYNALGGHCMKEFATHVADGQQLTGDVFPLLWSRDTKKKAPAPRQPVGAA